MAAYSSNVALSSYFVPRRCLADDAWEYRNVDDYIGCRRRRALVSSVIVTVIALLVGGLIVTLLLTGKQWTGAAIAGGISLAVIFFAWLNPLVIVPLTAKRTWAQIEQEQQSLRDLYPTLTDLEIRQKLREEKRQDRLLYATMDRNRRL